ncbi:MAG: hypothetical protein LBT47_06750 [Deltaproteobacteria bacterium]|jgi:hypothetical protein|nr:hypothetical protein [Deltaproteobacteria bacterium]
MIIDPQKLEAVFLRPLTETNQKNSKSDEIGNFAALLDGQSQNQSLVSEASSGLDESSAVLMSNSLLGLLQTSQAGQTAAPLSSLSAGDEVGGVLDLLEQYMAALGDPQKTLKEIAPLAEDLSREASKLDQLAAGLKSSDPLKQITNDTAVLAAVEALKFRRGDFV